MEHVRSRLQELPRRWREGGRMQYAQGGGEDAHSSGCGSPTAQVIVATTMPWQPPRPRAGLT